MLAKALGLSEGQPKNVLKCNEWFPCRTNKTGTHDATKKLGNKIKGFSSLLVYLLLYNSFQVSTSVLGYFRPYPAGYF